METLAGRQAASIDQYTVENRWELLCGYTQGRLCADTGCIREARAAVREAFEWDAPTRFARRPAPLALGLSPRAMTKKGRLFDVTGGSSASGFDHSASDRIFAEASGYAVQGLIQAS